jgi:hypothetical protein
MPHSTLPAAFSDNLCFEFQFVGAQRPALAPKRQLILRCGHATGITDPAMVLRGCAVILSRCPAPLGALPAQLGAESSVST